ncbi:MAG TPA: hypothetical protein HA257_01225 [Candidatus Methanoperedenaceae archaeon]|nr:hypothetical protein [Candidatus Methanoperedenaceae archaeon]
MENVRAMDDRGQLMLLAAFMVGFSLVVVTLMLNSILYSGNVAFESSTDPMRYDIQNIRDLGASELRYAYRSGNLTGSYVQNLSRGMNTLFGTHGVSIQLVNGTTFRPNLTQNGMPAGVANWTVVENVTTMTNFTLNLDYDRLASSDADAFEVQSVNSSNASSVFWKMKVYYVNPTLYVNITTQTSSIVNSSLSFPFFPFDLIQNRYGPSPGNYFAFNFTNAVSGKNYTIKFINGNKASGYYAFNLSGNYTYNRQFQLARDTMMNVTFDVFTSRARINLTVPVSIPW